MSQKNALTVLHSVIALGLTLGGITYSNSISHDRPLGALVVLLIAAVMPALIATRVAWASGYEAGRAAK